ncbi:restriction endonuclease [Sulfitobacter sp. M220]|jgi:type I restriction enzyme S subunit|uniref:restriction endonuclease subunit S n=1 Tax=Sulfitobacter sp. M220 TaxID=2675333 RepID=UPI001EFFAFAA|nr:restriction endonuclease subunit S [Sulfitobacter sp. M220]MCF7777425.1 restriction endonuclease [Sulfitobacter sp. M220]
MRATHIPLGKILKPAKTIKAGEHDYPLLSMTMRGGLVDPTTKFKKRVASDDTSAYKVVKRGQLVVGFPIDEGVLSFQKIFDAAIVSPAYGVWDVVDPEKVNPAYLEKFLKSPQAITYYLGKLRSTTARRRSLDRSSFLELPIPLPPLDEQKRIAGILDQADALRRLRTRALDKLGTLGQAIFHEMFGDPADNPKDFPRKKLLEIVRIIGGSQPAKKHFLYEDGPGRVRFIQTRDFRTDAYKTYVPEDLAKRPFSEDDVIIGRYGPPVFQIFQGLRGTYNVALMKAEPIGEITKDFIYYLLQEPKLHGYVVSNSERTAGQSGVNLDLLKEYPVYAPPIQLQEIFTERLQEVERLVSNTRQQNSRAEALFASLQHRAFRGEL